MFRRKIPQTLSAKLLATTLLALLACLPVCAQKTAEVTYSGSGILTVESGTPQLTQSPANTDAKVQELPSDCAKLGGKWLEEHQECEYMSREWCQSVGGTFDECASACRHSADPLVPCTMQCISVCKTAKYWRPPEGREQSKKEPERIYGVVPAYSITDARNLPPLKSGEKFKLFVSGTLDPFPFAVYAIQAGISQANDTHNGYGQGAEGYSKRFGAALGDGTSARFFSTFVFPSILHQDPRYFRKGEGSGWSRVGYSISRGFVTRGDSGETQPNWSNVFGKCTSAGLSNLYYPSNDRGATLTLTRVAISLSYQMLGNIAVEFWPEIHRKFLGGNKKQGSQTPKP
jgi:hypothetical protein